MAKAHETPEQTPAQTGAQDIAEALRALAPARKVTIGELVRRNALKTEFNPSGKPRRLKRPTFINGRPVELDTTTQEEYEIYPHLKPGKFVKGMVTIREYDRGAKGTELHIFYDAADRDKLLQLRLEGGHWTDTLKRCVAEAAAAEGK